jgi:hypothetical protein
METKPSNNLGIVAALLFGVALIGSVTIFGTPKAAPQPVEQPTVEPQVGSSAGPIDQTNYHCWAGVCEYFQAATLKPATTTPCAIQSPNATSTLIGFWARLDVASTAATTWDMAKATSPSATTTILGTAALAVAANAQAALSATSSAPTSILAPNTWVVLGARAGFSAGDAVGTGFVPTGTCYAKFLTSQS